MQCACNPLVFSCIPTLAMKNPTFFLIIGFLACTNGSKILFLTPFNGKSHWMLMQTIVEALLNRGHEVTAITSFKWEWEPLPQNYTEILIDPPMDWEKLRDFNKNFASPERSPFWYLFEFPDFLQMIADYSLSSENVQKFIRRTDLHFDLVINEEFFLESFLMFAHKYRAPVVTISTYGTSDFFDRGMGLLTPWSHVSHSMLSFSDNMSFYERCYNTAFSIVDFMLRRYVHLPKQMEVARKHFSHLEPLPPVEYLLKNISVILVYTHRSIAYPRPSMPGVINIGGAHIKPVKPLPDDIRTFLDGAEEGAIFFSTGTIIKSSRMPKDKMDAVLSCFRQLKQRILWKFENESIANLPPNVLIRKWLPQNDILAHKNVILFITHGGIFSTFETTWHGVPVLVTPFFGDQHRNGKRMAMAGYGKVLPFPEITEENFAATVNEMISNGTYRRKAQEVSAIFSSNLVHPMNETVFWIEYVIQFAGAKHLKSHAVHMSWYSYLLLDVIFGSILVFVIWIIAMYSVVRWIFRRCCERTTRSVEKKKKKN